MTLEIFCIVRSPMDSVLVSFGDLVASVSVSDLLSAGADSLKELDFFREDATSLLNAPNSWAKFFTTRDSGLGFNTDVT